jgi:hypothetical protein
LIPLLNRVDRKQDKLHGTPTLPFICVYVGQYAAKHILNKLKGIYEGSTTSR